MRFVVRQISESSPYYDRWHRTLAIVDTHRDDDADKRWWLDPQLGYTMWFGTDEQRAIAHIEKIELEIARGIMTRDTKAEGL